MGEGCEDEFHEDLAKEGEGEEGREDESQVARTFEESRRGGGEGSIRGVGRRVGPVGEVEEGVEERGHHRASLAEGCEGWKRERDKEEEREAKRVELGRFFEFP